MAQAAQERENRPSADKETAQQIVESWDSMTDLVTRIELALGNAREEAREEAAKMCDEVADVSERGIPRDVAMKCAAAIRSSKRGEGDA